MAIPKSTRLAVATDKMTKMDYSCQHITTSNFMDFTISKVIDMVPNQSINVRHEIFTRLEPMPVPTFGLASLHTNVFFVPYRTIFAGFNDMIGDVPHVYDNGETGFVPNVPYILYSDFSKLFTEAGMCTSVETGYDFQYSDGTDLVNMKFTALGRFAYKLLRTLGYNWTFTTKVNKSVSALPLLAVLRVYYDFYLTSQYSSTAEYAEILGLFTSNAPETFSEPLLHSSALLSIMRFLYKVYYQSDWINSAWDNPNSPNNGLSSAVKIPDISEPSGDIYDTIVTNGTSTHKDGSDAAITRDGGNSGLFNISQYVVNALRKLNDYLKRNQIAGSRVIDRYLARFGVELKSEKLNRSFKVASYVQDIQFGDVTSTSDTTGANLGAYAGKGISYGDGNFNFSTDEYGMLIFVTTIIPKVSYYQGEQRHVNHMTRLDFWTPEFDQLGTQAMASSEVYVAPNGRDTEINAPNYYDQIFGFVPRYSEYKVGYDQITGDYILPSLNTGKESWNLFRDVTGFVDSVGLDAVKHSESFINGIDSIQYNRIFYNTSDNADKFNVIHNFNISGSFPGAGLYDTYEFENEDKKQHVNVDVDGTQLQ